MAELCDKCYMDFEPSNGDQQVRDDFAADNNGEDMQDSHAVCDPCYRHLIDPTNPGLALATKNRQRDYAARRPDYPTKGNGKGKGKGKDKDGR